MIQHSYEYNLLLQTGALPEAWWNQNSSLLVEQTFMGTANKDASETPHVFALHGEVKNSPFYLAPFFKSITRQGAIHS
jgi:hypothetical protein